MNRGAVAPCAAAAAEPRLYQDATRMQPSAAPTRYRQRKQLECLDVGARIPAQGRERDWMA